ncbi:MAG: AI-2E family transporter [Actinomycetota bacterium]|nr:AI-2E family transporter [Actinomycetota bacterium]MDP3630709.1 AI-2E family transporter [Actinomycetota bacterium]
MPDARAREDRWRRILIVAWALIGILILVSVGGFALLKVAPALVPFMLAIVIVYLFRTPVAMLERRGLKRGLAVGICYAAAAVFLIIAGLFIVPPLVSQVGEFVQAFPAYYGRAFTLWQQLQTQFNAIVVPDWANQALLNLQDTISKQALAWSSTIAGRVFSVGSGAVSFLFNGFLAIVVGFWILKDLGAIKREVVLLAGPKRRDEASVISAKVSNVLGGYLRGQAVVSAATAVFVTIGLSIFGVPYALVLGLLAGVLNIIPWFGPLIAEVIAAIAAAFVSPWLALAAVLVIAGAQQLTDIFVTPRVMSEQVDLHPLLVIFSLLAGSALAGFVGMLLAIPVAAIAKGLFVYYFEKWTDSKLTTEEGAFFREKKLDAESGEDNPADGPGSREPSTKDADVEETE